MKFNRIVCGFSVVLMLCATSAHAQQDQAAVPQSAQATVDQFVARYPAGAIASVETADRVLAEAEEARTQLEAQYADQERACYSNFFTNACIDRAKERRRNGLAAIRPIKLEASAFKRKDKVAQRDHALEERQAKEAAEAKERMSMPQKSENEALQQRDERVREAQAKQARQASRASAADERVKKHQEKLERLREAEAREAPQREKNVADYEKKVEAANERQRKVTEKRAQKQREQQNKTIRAEGQ